MRDRSALATLATSATFLLALLGPIGAGSSASGGVPFFDWGHRTIELPANGADESTVVDNNDFGIVIGTTTTGGVSTNMIWAPVGCPPVCNPVDYIPSPVNPLEGFSETIFDLSNVGSGGFVYLAGARSDDETGNVTPIARRFFVNSPFGSMIAIDLPIPDGFDSGAALGVNRDGDAVGFVLDSTTGDDLGVYWNRTASTTYSAIPLDGTYQAVAVSDDGPTLASADNNTTVLYLNPETDVTDVMLLADSSTQIVPNQLGQTDRVSGAGQTRVVGGFVEPGEDVAAIVFADPVADPDTFLTIDAGQPSQATSVDSLGLVTVLQGEPGIGDRVAGFTLIGADLSAEADCSHGDAFDLGFCPLHNFVSDTSLTLSEPMAINERGEVAVTAVDPETGSTVAVVVAPITPVISLNPSLSISFGVVEVGDSSTLPVTIDNIGGDTLIVTNISLLQTDRPFTVTPPELPATVPAGQSTSFDWTFAPTAEGFFFVDVQILSNDPLAPDKSVSAIGNSVAPTPEPDITITPSEHDFGIVYLGDSATVDFTITNDGTEFLTVSEIDLSPLGSLVFTIVPEPVVPVLIPPGETATVTVQFLPVVEGEVNAALSIGSNDPDEAVVVVQITGTSIDRPDPPNVDLPIVNLGNVDLVEVELTGEIGNDYSLSITDGATIVEANGTFGDVLESVAVDLSGLMDGPITATAVQIDGEGDASEPGADNSVKDTVPPDIFVTLPDVNQANVMNVTVEINGEPGSDYQLNIDDGFSQIRVGGTIPESGTDEILLDLSTLDDGTLTAFVTATDDADNLGSDFDEANKDTESPGQPTVNMEDVNAANQTGAVVFVFGQGDVSANISVASDLEVFYVEGVTSPGGELSTQIDVSGLPDGELDIGAILTDDAGNHSEPGLGTAIKDTILPDPPNVELEGPINLGNQSSTQLDLSGEPGAELAGFVTDGGFTVNFAGTFDGVGLFTTDLDLSGLDDGTLTAAATQTDAVGNQSGPGTDQETKDATPPQVTITLPVGPAALPFGEDISVEAEVSDENSLALVRLLGCVSGDEPDCDPADINVPMTPTDDDNIWAAIFSWNDEVVPTALAVDVIDSFGNEAYDAVQVSFVRPEIEVSPFAVNLPETQVNTTSSEIVTVSNAGALPLLISAMNVADDGVGVIVTGIPELPVTLGPEESFDITVTLRPNRAGPVSTTLDIASNDPVEPTRRLMITGSGIALDPDIALSTTEIEFPDLRVGSTSTRTITVTNQGPGALTVGSVALGNEDAGFFVDGVPELPVALGVNESFDIDVTFAPGNPGSAVTLLDISSDDPDTPIASVALIGDAVQPDIDVTDTIDLGDLIVGESDTFVFEVDNVGTGDLGISSVSVLSEQADVDILGTLPATIPAGESGEYELVVIPSSIGPITVLIEIENDSPGEEIVDVEATGEATEEAPGVQDIEVTPARIDFGDADLRASPERIVRVRNVGTNVLVVDTYDIRQPEFIFADIGPVETPIVLLPGEAFQLSIAFEPLDDTAYTAELAIASDDPDEPEVLVPMTGTGVVSEDRGSSPPGEDCQTVGSGPLDDPALPLLAVIASLRWLMRRR